METAGLHHLTLYLLRERSSRPTGRGQRQGDYGGLEYVS